MDSLTAHYLARELHARWSGRRVAACALDRERLGVVLAVGGSAVVRIDLAVADPRACIEERASGGGLLTGWQVAAVSAPVDDRRLVLEFERPGKFRGSASRRATLEISMVPSARGVMLRDESGRRLASAGAAPPPAAEPRPVLTDAEVEDGAASGDTNALMRGRWMSPALARWLLSDPERAATRYRKVCELPEARPSRCEGRVLPLPLCPDPVAANSLVEPAPADQATPRPPSAGHRERAIERMRRELARAAAAPRLRMIADALMALGDIGETPAEVTLADGTRARVDARAGDTPVKVAERLYRDVRSMERALETLPVRIAALERGPDGPEAADPRRTARAPARTQVAGPARPFRVYRSSGGLEIWVGRGAKSNDRLTFDEAAPDDVWLHARDVSGAHVVLRWQRAEPPPARDLAEAALLAAWHSRARGSAVVPVDWTRRKYVRKPRGGAPGLVLVTRAETVFARPSAEAERRLRAGG